MNVDPRGLRFAAWVTSAVLAAVLVVGSARPGLAAVLLGAQTAVFAAGAFAGVRRAPYGVLFRRLLVPRLGPPAELEPTAPPRFAQGVGLAFGLAGAIAYALGSSLLGAVATGLALAAAFLNAAFGYCLGCELYLLI